MTTDGAGPTLRERFDAMVAVLREVQAEMHRLVALEEAGEALLAQRRACMIAWPPIAVKMDHLRRAAQRPGAAAELAGLIAQLHLDLLLLREVLAGRVVLSAPEDN